MRLTSESVEDAFVPQQPRRVALLLHQLQFLHAVLLREVNYVGFAADGVPLCATVEDAAVCLVLTPDDAETSGAGQSVAGVLVTLDALSECE